ncbi:MAG: PAS domain S-box protein [Proteobacteria bacterium]|nr:PAS domain S-box protein [Pseudomonadota bacterium]
MGKDRRRRGEDAGFEHLDASRSDGDPFDLVDRQQRAAALARHFLGLGANATERELRDGLAAAADLAGAQRACLTLVGPDAEVIVSHEWPPAESWSSEEVPHDIRTAYPWAAMRVSRGQVVQISRGEDPARKTAAEIADLERRDVHSLLCLPLEVGGRIAGYLLFECTEGERSWSRAEILPLQLLGEIFGAAVHRQLAREAYRESEERLRALSQHPAELIAECDANGRMLYVNGSWESCLGWSPTEIIGRGALDFVHPDDHERVRRTLGRAISEEGAAEATVRALHKDGSARWFEAAGRAFHTAQGRLRLVVAGRDVTERQRIQSLLSRQRDLEALVSALSRRFVDLPPEEIDTAIQDGLAALGQRITADRSWLVSLDVREQRFLAAHEWRNEGVESALPAFDASAFGRFPWTERRIGAGHVVNFPDVSRLPPEAVAERQSLEERGVRSLLAIPLMSGESLVGLLCFEAMQSAIRESDESISLLRVMGDVFLSALARKRTEAALQESRQQLLQSQKMEAVGRLAGGIAHDFNNLLMVIGGCADTALRYTRQDDPRHEDLEEIRQASERAATLTRQLLAFSRRQSVTPRVVDLNAVVAGLEDLLRRVLGEDVELQTDFRARRSALRADPGQLEQVLVNLAVNARDAMPEGGTLCVRITTPTFLPGEIQALKLAKAPFYVSLAVSDTGLGMDETTRAHIFDPFFTTKDVGKGSGLGLAIVFGIVEQWGGAIRVESAPGLGARFELVLPGTVDALPGSRDLQDPAAEGGDETILVVEDESAVRRLVRRLLESAGYRVLEAQDGVQALEVARAHPQSLDLVLSDLVMPHMGGLELARRLRKLDPELRILFLSGYPRDHGSAEWRDFQDTRVLQKPFSADVLLSEIRQALDPPPAGVDDGAGQATEPAPVGGSGANGTRPAPPSGETAR